jgi:hypothetical protein
MSRSVMYESMFGSSLSCKRVSFGLCAASAMWDVRCYQFLRFRPKIPLYVYYTLLDRLNHKFVERPSNDMYDWSPFVLPLTTNFCDNVDVNLVEKASVNCYWRRCKLLVSVLGPNSSIDWYNMYASKSLIIKPCRSDNAPIILLLFFGEPFDLYRVTN